MSEHTYTAVFEPAEEGGYVVYFPAVPNLATQGETLEEARAMAEDCLQGYLEWRLEDGLPLPEGEMSTAEQKPAMWRRKSLPFLGLRTGAGNG